MLSALALAPSQSGLQLTNVRNTYGELGGTRPDSPLIPGDVLFIGFDIEGITVTDEGRVTYTMSMEVLDKSNKPVFKQDPAQKEDFLPLGGNKLPARAFVIIGLDQQPGEYTVKLTVTDNANKASQTLTRKFTVAPPQFGIVAVHASANEQGSIQAPTVGAVGQPLFIHFAIVGFDRANDPKDPKLPAQPNVTIEMVPLDERGQPTLKKPLSYVLDEKDKVDEKDAGFPMRFLLPLTRTGKFTVRLKATDNLSKKSTTFDLPITVVPPGN
jgi:hypothetical protein